MNDLDRLLKQSLTEVQESFSEARTSDRLEARVRFIERYRRRRIIFRAGSAVLVGAAVLAAFAFSTGRLQLFADDAAEIAGRIGRGVVAQIDTGRYPVDIGLRPDGAWVVHQDDSILSLVNPATNELIDTIPLEGPAQEVDVGQGTVWVAGFGHVTPIDLQTNELARPAKVGARGETIEISVGEGAVWAVVGNQRLVRIDPTTLEVDTIEGLTAPRDVAAREGAVWVLDEDQGLVRLDPTTGSPTPDKPIAATATTGDILVGGGLVWIADENSNTILQIKPRTLAFSGVFQVPGTYLDMAVREDAVWVLSRRNDRTLLTAFDPVETDALAEPVRLRADAVEVSASSTGVWVVTTDKGLLHVDPDLVLDED
jgi:streptogramin lyase